MRHYSERIEARLQEVENWWKLQRLLNRTIFLVLALTACVFCLGAAIVSGWLTQPTWATIWMVLLVFGSLVGWVVMALQTYGIPQEQEWLAASLEKSRGELEDRLNTLIYLQQKRDPTSMEISRELERDLDKALRRLPSSCPFPWKQTLQRGMVCLLVLLLTVGFYQKFEPWNQLQAAMPAPVNNEEEEIADLEIPETHEQSEDAPEAEEDKIAWGEIRITEPGRDLKVTRLDLIPLMIEVASNRELESAQWVTLVSDGPTENHGLPAPDHPNYVVYRPSLLIEDYELEEWDLISYYAEALTKSGERYQSIEYFIQVVPPRPDLEQLPQPAYDSLEQFTGLIEWQQDVIRETGRLAQLDQLDQEDVARRHSELAQQQQQIEQATEHLTAELRSQFGDEPLEGLQERFEEARFSSQDAHKALEEQESSDALQNERVALGRLNNARKHFHERVKENPAAFENSLQEQLENREKAADLTVEALEEFQTELQERKEALGDMQQNLNHLINRQKLVETQTRRANNETFQKLADKEQQVNQDLQQLAQDAPQMDEGFQSAAKEASETLNQAQQALANRDKENATQETADATKQLEQMAEQLQTEIDQNELMEQVLLEHRLRLNREEYRQIEQQSEPSSAESLEEIAQETQDIVEELDRIAQQQTPESPDDPPSPLQQEMTPEKQKQLSQQCDSMCKNPGSSGQSKQAGEIGSKLEKLSEALRQATAPRLASQQNQQMQQNLEQMQATGEQLQQAREAVQKALQEQSQIERKISRTPKAQPELSEQQKQTTDKLEEAMKQNHEAFSQCEKECNSASKSMRQSERLLQSANSLSKQRASEASEELRRLDSALEEQQQLNNLADAYRQQQMLEKQIEQLKEFEQKPESVSPSQCKSSGGACKKLTSGMQQLMQQPGMSGAFGPQMQKALSEENKQQIDQQSDQLAQSESAEQVQKSTGELRESLEKLARAMQQGQQPGQALAKRPGNSLKPSGQKALAEGMRRLESESQRNQQGRPVQKGQSHQMRQDALSNLSEGLFGVYGYNSKTRLILSQWKEDLEDTDFTVDQRVIQQLLRDIQQMRGKIGGNQSVPTDQKPDVSTIDPSKYPPEYRPLIENYFQKLSEQP